MVAAPASLSTEIPAPILVTIPVGEGVGPSVGIFDTPVGTAGIFDGISVDTAGTAVGAAVGAPDGMFDGTAAGSAISFALRFSSLGQTVQERGDDQI